MFKFEMKNAVNANRFPIQTVELIECLVDRSVFLIGGRRHLLYTCSPNQISCSIGIIELWKP